MAPKSLAGRSSSGSRSRWRRFATRRRSIPAAVHQRFVERRARLNDHVRRLHVARKPSDLSIFQLQGRLLRMQDTSCPVRWRGEALKALTSERRRQVVGLLEEASGFPGLFTGRDPGPWTHAIVNDAAEAQRAHDLATRDRSQRDACHGSRPRGVSGGGAHGRRDY